MKKVWVLLIFFAFGICFAEQTVILYDGSKAVLKDDYTWEYYTEPTPIPTVTPIKAKYADEAVEVWDSSLELIKVNYQTTDAVALHIHYKNNTDKKVIGVSTYVIIINPFGKVVLERTYDDEISLEPLEKQINTTFWYFENNEFIKDEVYDKTWQMAQKGTAKIKTKIIKVVFDDLTVLKARPSKKK